MKARESQKGKNISVSISDKSLMARIEKVSEKVKIKPRQFIKNSIEIGVEEMSILNNIGYIKAAFILKSFKDQFKAALDEEAQKLDVDNEIGGSANHFTIWLDHEIIEKLDYFQKKLSLKSRSELINRLIKMNLRDLFYFEVTGLLNMTVFLRDMWRKRFKETQEAVDKGEIKVDLK